MSTAVALIGAEQAPLLARPHYEAGPPSPVTASLAHVPELLEANLPFVGRVLGPSAIDARTKEIVILRTSALLDCRYCIQTHSVAALDARLSRDEVMALRGEGAIEDAFSEPSERALIAWVDTVAGGRGPVDPETVARAQSCLGEADLVELTLVAGATLMLNRYCTALGLPTATATLGRLAEEGLE